MGRYRARDLLLLPSLVSLTRLPLAAAFVAATERPSLALGVLGLAGLSDVLDGFLARRLGQATATGAVVDGVVDKLFAAIVIGGSIAQDRLPWGAALLLGARELGELPLVVWWLLHRDRRAARARDPRANWLGKLATVLQFNAIAVLLLDSSRAHLWLALAVAAAAGLASAGSYWRRELRSARASRPSPRTLGAPRAAR